MMQFKSNIQNLYLRKENWTVTSSASSISSLMEREGVDGSYQYHFQSRFLSQRLYDNELIINVKFSYYIMI